jgi:hypothetical protein
MKALGDSPHELCHHCGLQRFDPFVRATMGNLIPWQGLIPELVAWVVDVDPEVWTIDISLLPDTERQEIRKTIESWAESGPPETITTLVFGRMLHEFQLPNGIAI